MINYVCYIFGFVLGKKKETPPTSSISLLGADITIAQFHIDISLPLRKRTELIDDLGKILQKRRLTPAGAAKIRLDKKNSKNDPRKQLI